MQAVVRYGGKQYVVTEDSTLEVHRVKEEAKSIELEVLAVFDDQKTEIGTPTLADVKVIAEVIGDKRSKKIHVYKYKSKIKYRRKIGHRDDLSIIKIKSIKA